MAKGKKKTPVKTSPAVLEVDEKGQVRSLDDDEFAAEPTEVGTAVDLVSLHAKSGKADEDDADQDSSDEDGAGDSERMADEETLVNEFAQSEETDAELSDEPTAVDAAVQVVGEKAKKSGLARRDPLAAYVNEVRRFPLLTREEEHALAVRLVDTGDAKAARKLIESNLRLVIKLAYEYRRAHKNLLDLIQEGNIGLMQAVKKFDPHRGIKLSSYAAWWIRAYILKFILNNWRLVKIGTTQAQRKLFFNLRKEREKLERLGFAAEPKLLAEKLDVRESDVREMEERLAAPDASFDAPLSTEGEGLRTRHDTMAAGSSGRPDVQVEEEEFHTLLKEKLEIFAKTLKGREETIFRQRWLTDSPLTLQELGDTYGVSRERARQLEKRMLDRLREYLQAELGTSVDIGFMARE